MGVSRARGPTGEGGLHRLGPRVAGAGAIRTILRARLPERFAGKLPPWLVEIVVGVATPVLLAIVRLAFVPWTGEQAPFALVFVGVVGATVLAGWRSGLLALVIGQLATWYLVIERGGGDIGRVDYLAGLILAGLAELMALIIIALYQRDLDDAWSKRESRMELLDKALKEIDHRTTNNYQTVLALILAQAKRADEPVRQALKQVADRITAVAEASRKLALSSESLRQVRVGDHLRELTAQIERGLSRPGIVIEAEFDDVAMAPDRTVFLSILVNELVTNALKHAFPDDRDGTIRIILSRDGGGLVLMVEDDGKGMAPGSWPRGTGLGGQLIATFTRQLRAKHDLSSDAGGTRHRLRIPA